MEPEEDPAASCVLILTSRGPKAERAFSSETCGCGPGRAKNLNGAFMSERDGPMTPKAFHALFGRIGARTKLQFPVHPHMLRHGCGYALANARIQCATPRWRRIGSRISGDRAPRDPTRFRTIEPFCVITTA